VEQMSFKPGVKGRGRWEQRWLSVDQL